MKHHLLCLTIDTDPDGLSGPHPDRSSLRWEGLSAVRHLPDELDEFTLQHGANVPVTWFIRVDGQLQAAYGTSTYLLEVFGDFWSCAQRRGDELGWHPHLYRGPAPAGMSTPFLDPAEACDELERLRGDLSEHSFVPQAFRNGEGWHHPKTFSKVESLGLLCDSTAIPGRGAGPEHPMDWTGAPNQPYYPDQRDIRRPGPERALLELPMNTWLLMAPYDRTPRLRYMNPAVHERLFLNALGQWRADVSKQTSELSVWVMIVHPDEVMSARRQDLLYAGSRQGLLRNLLALVECVVREGHSFEFVTVSDAALRWRRHTGIL